MNKNKIKIIGLLRKKNVLLKNKKKSIAKTEDFFEG